MSQVGFVCPDGEKVKFAECNAGCRMGQRCATRPILKKIQDGVRQWKGKASTTQLLNGTMSAYLEIANDWYQSVNAHAFSLLGTLAHEGMDVLTEGCINEHVFPDLEITGIPDLFQKCEDGSGEYDLYDYKTSGSYKIAKALGFYKEEEDVLDDEGNQVLFKSGPRKGQVKTRRVSKFNPAMADLGDWAMQLNRYRILGEENLGIKVRGMYIQSIVRDGGVEIATRRGLEQNMYIIPVPRLDDLSVKTFYAAKNKDLHQALEQGGWATPCNEDERWNDRKCQGYCPVSAHCPHGRVVGGQ